MKKILICCFVLPLVAILASGLSLGADSSESISVHRNKVNLEVNSVRVTVDNFLYNGTTYVPIRAVAGLLGKEVGWNGYTNVASINDIRYELVQLAVLLPDKEGFTWLYDGFAEYGHQMRLDQLTDEPQRRVYSISGEVYDASSGEGTLDRNISIEYILEGNRLRQKKSEEMMLDSKYNSLTLIKTPLDAGTFWSEKVMDKSGEETLLNALITKVEVTSDNKKQYTVRHEDSNSGYYEERIIKEGIGVIAFEKLLIGVGDSPFPVNYFLHMSGGLESISLNLYFPDINAQNVFLEEREMLVLDAAVARAAVQELINGPVERGLAPSIPEGTHLLDIFILDRVCYVDFSREFIDNHSGGSAGEMMTLASIVNSLTDFDTIDRVQILVVGESDETLGSILLDRPLERMAHLIGGIS